MGVVIVQTAVHRYIWGGGGWGRGLGRGRVQNTTIEDMTDAGSVAP